MRVGIDTLFETPRAGTGGLTYLMSLVEGMGRVKGDHEVVVFVSEANRSYFDGAPGVDVVEVGASNESIGRRIWTQQVRLDRAAQRMGCDALLGAGNSVPLFGRVPSAVVLHSLLFLTQLNHPDIVRGIYRRNVVRESCVKARRIIPVSQYAADALLRWEPSFAPKTRVVLEGVGHGFTSERHGRDPYEGLRDDGSRILLFASRLWPYKNVDVCIRALAAYRGSIPVRLAVVGGDFKGEEARLRNLAGECGVTDRVRFLGHVPQQEMPRMYSWADCFVYPSRREWFGLPLLEAMASGVPVLAARTSCIPEIAGYGALFFDADDFAGMANDLETVMTDAAERAALVERGFRRAQEFSWERCARETLAVLQEVAKDDGGA